MNNQPFHILAISGSVRTKSSNSALLRAAATLAPPALHFTFYEGLDRLPHFNPDLDGDSSPETVNDLRAQLRKADGVIICTPEYAGGVPGVLKNAIDWIVSSGEFMHKPVSVISASPLSTGGEQAHASLLVTLGMVDAAIVEGGTMTVPFVGKKMNAEGEVTDPATVDALRSLLAALAEAVQSSSLHTPVEKRSS
ncbi:MAG: NADPH-dependent FMN reductase [Clostridia bacterium]